jgi:hypothetical protein
MGATVQVGLPEGGYDGQVIVTIDSTDRAGFGTDWESVRIPGQGEKDSGVIVKTIPG